MKRKSTTPRSFLRQLAEPIPRTAAPVIPRRPTVERGAATRSSLDAIPQIIDATETKHSLAAEPQHTQQASSAARGLPSRRIKTSPRSESSQVTSNASTSGVHAQPAKQSSANTVEPVLQSTIREYTSTQTKTPPTATQEIPSLQSVLAQSISAQADAPLLPTQPPQTPAKTERRPDISVHIGTIEVRVPAPPARTTQPAPASLNPRNSQRTVPSRASEPLSRSLAWSHGLVQG